jgi:hypothetical protein
VVRQHPNWVDAAAPGGESRSHDLSADAFLAGRTEEQYRTMLAVVRPPDGLPDGQISHAAGPTEGGYLISALWDSTDRFVSEVLMASMPVEGGYQSQPEERAAEVSNYQTRES